MFKLFLVSLLLIGAVFGSATGEEPQSLSIRRDNYLSPSLTIDTTFFYSNTMKLNTSARLLVGTNPNDLTNGDVICPGVVTANTSAFVRWIDLSTYAFSAACAFPLDQYIPTNYIPPVDGYTSPQSITWTENLFKSVDDFDEGSYITQSDTLYSQIPEGVKEQVAFWPDSYPSTNGNSTITFIGNGSVVINANAISKSTKMEKQEDLHFDLTTGDWPFRSTLTGINARGVIHQLIKQGGVQSEAFKYVYGTTASLPRTTTNNPSITVLVRDPQSIHVTLLGSSPTQTMMDPNDTIETWAHVGNDFTNYLNITAINGSADGGFNYTPTAGFNESFAAGTDKYLYGNLTAPPALFLCPIDVNVTLYFNSSPNCENNILYTNVNYTIHVTCPTVGPNLEPILEFDLSLPVGDSTTIWINTTNTGTARTVNQSNTTLAIDGGEVYRYLVGDLTPGDTVGGSYPYTCTAVGSHLINGTVDVDSTVQEIDETDNTAIAVLVCTPEEVELVCVDYI